MFAASATYHSVKARPQVMKLLRKLDHSAIYLLIAGTYTPICLHYFSGFWQWGMVALIWALAIAGICAKLVFINAPRWLTAGIYLADGLAGIVRRERDLHQHARVGLGMAAAGGSILHAGGDRLHHEEAGFLPRRVRLP